EIITSAVSPDANIIFGATLKPELEDELIITVIATGFDSPFSEAMHSSNTASQTDNSLDKAVEEIDDKPGEPTNPDEAAHHFADENNSGNLWTEPETPADDEDDTPAFLRRRKKKQQESDE